jgi:uroporphyrinogen-III decarboxylase
MGKSMFDGVVCGGLSRWQHVHYGTPTTVRDQARQAISQVNGRRFILSTGCVTMISSPLSNIHAVREVVESAGV